MPKPITMAIPLTLDHIGGSPSSWAQSKPMAMKISTSFLLFASPIFANTSEAFYQQL